jgi:hypothetical protein
MPYRKASLAEAASDFKLNDSLAREAVTFGRIPPEQLYAALQNAICCHAKE